MKNALIRDFSPETKRGGTNISNIIKAAILWVWLALTQGVHAKSDKDIVTVDIESDNNIVTVDIDWNTFNYDLWDEDLLATCDKYIDKSEKLLEDCITWAETAMEAQTDLINKKLNESEIGLANSETELANSKIELASSKIELASSKIELASSKIELASSKIELASSKARLKDAQARNEQTKIDMKIAKDQMDEAEKKANRVYKQERKNVLAN